MIYYITSFKICKGYIFAQVKVRKLFQKVEE